MARDSGGVGLVGWFVGWEEAEDASKSEKKPGNVVESREEDVFETA